MTPFRQLNISRKLGGLGRHCGSKEIALGNESLAGCGRRVARRIVLAGVTQPLSGSPLRFSSWDRFRIHRSGVARRG